MHLSWSTNTMPSSGRLYEAPVGHTVTHSAVSQCMQDMGKFTVLLCGYSSTSKLRIRLNQTPLGAAP